MWLAAVRPELLSDFALLDVKKGRHALAKHLKKHGPIKVLIEAEIECPTNSKSSSAR